MPELCRSAREDIEDLQFEDGATTFFPLDKLRSYFKFEKIKEILKCTCSQCQDDLRMLGNQTDRDTYVNHIMGGSFDVNNLTKTYYSVFGLLVYVEHPQFIVGFLDRAFNDYMLESWVTYAAHFSRKTLKQFTGDYSNDAIRFERFARRFEGSLPKFAVPHMESEKFLQYNPSVMLPFIEEKEIGKRQEEDGHWTSEGANGRVFAFRVYGEYNKFANIGLRTEFARKRIDTPQPLAFLERSNIQYVQRFNDPHIVKLIKAYGHGTTINLIFPKAWTNLDHLLRDARYEYDRKRGARIELANAWKQLLGISRALKRIHGYGDGDDSREGDNMENQVCIHFDLKPDNILVQRPDGNWMITDFGQAALTQGRRGTTPRVGGHFGTDAYAPPEIDDETMDVGRKYDVWSLGCIMLEVTTFMVRGYVGLRGATSFVGLDQARRAMPSWARNIDERFFYRESPGGKFVLKKEICDFMVNLQGAHARSKDSSEESKEFLAKILELINRMLKPNVEERVDMSRVVETLSSALKRASTNASAVRAHEVLAMDDETILGGLELNRIELWHWEASNREWEDSKLEAFETRAEVMRLHCWSHRGSTDISFRRRDVKILPLYAFWNPEKMHDSRTWIDFSYLTADQRSGVSNAKFSFDGNSGLEEARTVQSKLTSQAIVGSFSLSHCVLKRPKSIKAAFKGIWRKTKPDEDLGSATVQIWVEQREVARESLVPQEPNAGRAVRNFEAGQLKVPPCRVVIYLHKLLLACTLRIDVNWVLDDCPSEEEILYFKPNPQNGVFYASWIRPTQEELNARYPAGIPLSPEVLMYYEDVDIIEVENFRLQFLSKTGRENFKSRFWETKKAWAEERKNEIPVNTRPEGKPQPPNGCVCPIPPKQAKMVATSSELPGSQPVSNTSTNHSRHDSTLEGHRAPTQNPQFLVIPENRPHDKAGRRMPEQM
ncbi:kinase-like protein [Decorospora gaudefroyi]|uniref:Kinase-like protein n=1 Tax=Decorospora gaudefroyi TaxID=184978 RepID=A0A6A5KWC8_9PLEO|nr:kinase-like protein [Decorospora gaudefroyi]